MYWIWSENIPGFVPLIRAYLTHFRANPDILSSIILTVITEQFPVMHLLQAQSSMGAVFSFAWTNYSPLLKDIKLQSKDSEQIISPC